MTLKTGNNVWICLGKEEIEIEDEDEDEDVTGSAREPRLVMKVKKVKRQVFNPNMYV